MTHTIRETQNFTMFKSLTTGGISFMRKSNGDISLFDHEMPENRIIYLIGCSAQEFDSEAEATIAKHPLYESQT